MTRSRSFPAPLVGWLLGLAFVALTGCKRPGASCSAAAEGERSCTDASTLLVCQNRQYRAFACQGKDGCSGVPEAVRCDYQKNPVGSPCAATDKGTRFCTSDRQALLCDGDRLVVEECAGGCTLRAGPEGTQKVDCDRGHPEGKCDSKMSPATCSADRREQWACVDDQWTLWRSCLGPNQCKGDLCDTTVAAPGSRCDRDKAGTRACTPERNGALVCEGATWKVADTCAAGQKCSIGEVNIEYDGSGRLGGVILNKTALCR